MNLVRHKYYKIWMVSLKKSMRKLSGAAARTGDMKKQDIKKYYKNRMVVVV